MADESRRCYGVQFHPEVTHTAAGPADPAALRARHLRLRRHLWTAGNIIDDEIARVRAPGRRATRCCSGCPAASIPRWWRRCCTRRIGDQLTCVFVDTGLLRCSEGDQVMAMFAEHLGVKVIRVNAAERFLDGARRRRRSGGQAQDHRPPVRRGLRRGGRRSSQDVKWLAQGTIYPDVIESAGSEDRQGARDQVPPQRRRPARAHEAEAGRAAARAVQGRGAPHRRRARPAARDGLPPPVPRPRPGRAHPGRGEAASTPTCCARPTTSSSRSCARPTCTTRSARPSRCSCR